MEHAATPGDALEQVEETTMMAVDLVGLLPAGLREIGPAAASSADDRCNLFHNLAGLDAARQVGRDRESA